MICPREEDWRFSRSGGGVWSLWNAFGEFVMGGLEFCPWCGCELGVEDHRDYPQEGE